MKHLLCLLMLMLMLVLAGCNDLPGEWSSIVYPDKTDRTKFLVTARFKTLNYCLTQALDQMKAIQVSTGGDYECGRNCGVSGDPHKGNICEEVYK